MMADKCWFSKSFDRAATLRMNRSCASLKVRWNATYAERSCESLKVLSVDKTRHLKVEKSTSKCEKFYGSSKC